MTRPDAEKVKSFVVNYLIERDPDRRCRGGRISDDAFDFLAAGIIDSMGVLELIAEIELEFNITVDFEEMDPEAFSILGLFCSYVAENAVVDGE